MLYPLILLSSLSLAQSEAPPVPAEAQVEAHALLDAGDRAWFAEDRRLAHKDWKAAAKAEDPAVATMAELRLLFVSGSVGLILHGRRADMAMERCTDPDPWCDLARADYELVLAALGVSGDVGLAVTWARAASGALPGPALARAVWAGAAPSEALAEVQTDGLGAGLLASHGVWPHGPGTWVLGLGLLGGPGVGAGAAVRFVHPDLNYKARVLEVSALATTRGAFAGSATLRTPGKVGLLTGISGTRAVLDIYGDGGLIQTEDFLSASAWAGPALNLGRTSVWAAPLARYDQTDTLLAGHGAFAGARWTGLKDGVGPSLRASTELALADYKLWLCTLDARAYFAVPGGVLAVRALGQGAPVIDPITPLVRLPSAGGSEILRGAPAGRYRGPWLAATAIEWRHPWNETVSSAVFGELVWVDDESAPGLLPDAFPGLHPGGGIGLRLSLPPRPNNTLRLDAGLTDAGWGLALGYGEAF